MRWIALLAGIVCTPAIAQQHIAPTNALSPQDELASFTVPKGFAVQLVASEPDIEKPMQIAWDSRGRLWVTTSHHYPFAAEPGKASDKLFVLSDFNANGKAKKIQVFDDKLNIPIGILPLPDGKSCIVSSCGEILKLTDTNADGVADTREVLFTGFGFTDTHGMTNSFTLMPDGWVYACHGFSNKSKVKGKDGHEIEMHSGHTFRFRTDGSRIEIYTRGQVNPFGMTWDNHFNLYTADCHSKPITQLIPGAYYDSFGKPHDGLGYAPHTTKHDHGSTGLCGLAWYEADHFPKEWNGCMFLGNVVTNRINVDHIVWKGATPVAEELPDFLVSKDPWFRPTDIKLGADGALYVSDFYNKIVGHYEVDLKHPQRDKIHGRVWRIVWVGEGKQPLFKDNISLETATEKQLNEMAKNKNIVSRKLVGSELERRKLPNRQNVEVTSGLMVWVNVNGNRNAKMQFIKSIIEAPNSKYVDEYLLRIAKVDIEDTHLRHAGKIALRECLKNVDQWGTPENEAEKALLLEVALGSRTKGSVIYLEKLYGNNGIPDSMKIKVAEHLGRCYTIKDTSIVTQSTTTKDGAIYFRACEAFFKGTQTLNLTDTHKQRLFGELDTVMAIYHKWEKMHPKELMDVLRAALPVMHTEQVGAIFRPLCIEIINNTKNDEATHLSALETLSMINKNSKTTELHKYLDANVYSIRVRESVAVQISSSKATTDLATAIDFLKTASAPTARQIATNLAKDKLGADLLFAAIRNGTASPRLLQDKTVVDTLKATKIPDLSEKIATLTKDIPTADARLAALIKSRNTYISKSPGDATKGKELFAKNCAACHRIGDDGGKVGPNLDGIGTRGLERLLEDTLDPNRNVDNAFRASKFEMKDGKQVVGLLVRTEGAVYVVADAEGKEQRLPTAQVDSHTILPLSPMPTDVAEKLKEDEFAHLMAYLLSVKAK